MFELFLVMMALTSPILIIIFVRNYFNYKSEVNQKFLALQQENDINTQIVTQKKLDVLIKRVIVLEKIALDNNIDLSREISQLG